MGICRSLCQSFSLKIWMSLYFPLLNYTGRFTSKKVCYRILLLLFYFAFSFFFAYLLLYVPLDEQIPFYRKQFSPSFNKNGKLQLPTWSLP